MQALLLRFYIRVFRIVRSSSLCVLASIASEHSFAQSTNAPWVGATLDGRTCEGKQQGYGPFDYSLRGGYAENLKLVEDFHFTPDVERLTRRNRESLATNIDYTLRAWPNHHRALRSMMRLRSKSTRIEDMKFQSVGIPPMECYFNRAIQYSPKDSVARMLQGMFFHQEGMLEDAQEAYEAASSLSPDDLQIKYNLALLLVDREQYDRAKSLAETVYAADFPFPGLRRKLQEAGKW